MITLTWNKEKIKSTLNELNSRILRATDERQLEILKRDYNVLLAVLKKIDAAKEYEEFETPSVCLDKSLSSFKHDSYEAVYSHKELLIKLGFLANKNITDLYVLGGTRKIHQDDYLEMNIDFFKNYDLKHYELFKKLLNENIRFAKNKKEVGRAQGLCFHLFSLNEPYILIDYRRRENISILAHEVAHAYEYSLIDEYSHHKNLLSSSFVECYPRFIELLFLDYCFNNDSTKQVGKEIFHLFDCVKAVSEYTITKLSNLSEPDPQTGRFKDTSGNLISKKFFDFTISDFLAIYMFNLYKNDRYAFEKFIMEYHSYKGVNDKFIWDMITGEELEKAFLDETYELSRKLVHKKK